MWTFQPNEASITFTPLGSKSPINESYGNSTLGSDGNAAASNDVGSYGSVEGIQYYDQVSGRVEIGPGARKEAILLGVGLPRLNSRQKDELSRAKKYAMEQSIKAVLMKQTVQHQQQQQKLAMYAQAMSLMARVYIGSISFELREDTVKAAFLPFGPIKSINMSWDSVTGHHKGFAFLEYEVPEAATLAQEQMNGVLIGGRNIKVGRPSNMPQAQPIIESIMEEAKLHHRVYVSSIHIDLTEQDIKSVFEAFGNIINVDLPKGLQGKHKGYAYIDFDNGQAAIDAVASMNLFDLGGQFLRVGRAITPPMAQQVIVPPTTTALPTASAVAAAAVTAKIQALETPVAAPSVSPAPVAPAIPVRTLSPAPTITVPPPGVAIPQLPLPSVVKPVVYAAAAVPLQNATQETQSLVDNAKGNFPHPNANLRPSPSNWETPVVQEPPMYAQAEMPSVELGLPSVQMPAPFPPVPPQPPPLPSVTVAAAPPTAETAAAAMTNSDSTQRLLQNSSPVEQRQKVVDLEAAQTLAAQEDLKIKGNEARNILMHKLMKRFESRVIVLRNMVSAADVDEYLHEEVTEECARFGEVERVVIYQEQVGEDADSTITVKVFVKYSTVQEAEKAKNAFDGRFFSGRQIKAELYDQTMFELNDLSG
uniref:RRM domain-containing protein n=1 Tax=Trichuris muris TaxID=70415 RepID=A0A5S6QKN1_TRIMR